MCVAALCALLARYAPPSFASTSARFAVNSCANRVHRQCFDHEDSAWVSPPSATLAAPFPVVAPDLTCRTDPSVENVMDGWHYNRPPPIS